MDSLFSALEKKESHAEGITATNDGRVVVVGTYFFYVHVFNGQGEHRFKFSLEVERYYLCLDVPFHWPNERILVAGKEEGNENLRVLVYSKEGEFLREIQHKGKWVSSFAGIIVTSEGRLAAVVERGQVRWLSFEMIVTLSRAAARLSGETRQREPPATQGKRSFVCVAMFSFLFFVCQFTDCFE